LKRPKLVWHWVSLGVFVPHQRSSYVLSWPPLICWRHFELNVRCVDEDTFEFELNVRCVDEGAARAMYSTANSGPSAHLAII
jgi:hypothetical protein